ANPELVPKADDHRHCDEEQPIPNETAVAVGVHNYPIVRPVAAVIVHFARMTVPEIRENLAATNTLSCRPKWRHLVLFYSLNIVRDSSAPLGMTKSGPKYVPTTRRRAIAGSAWI